MEEEKLRDLEAAEKVRETGISRMIIGEILCLFLLPKLHILLDTLYFYSLHGLVTRKSRNQMKRDTKSGIFRHINKNIMVIPNSFLFQVGTY